MPIAPYISTRLVEQCPGLLRVARLVAVDEHPGIPATHFGLRDPVRQRVRLSKGGLEVVFGGRPLLSGAGGHAGEHLPESLV